jgi:hypothetical protein
MLFGNERSGNDQQVEVARRFGVLRLLLAVDQELTASPESARIAFRRRHYAVARMARPERTTR